MMLESKYKKENMLSEAYFGKNPNILKIEEQFGEMKQILLSGKNINGTSVLKEFEKTVADTFGFERCIYSVLPDENVGNSFATPFFWEYTKSYDDSFFDVEKSSNGQIKFKNPKGKYLYVYGFNFCFRNWSKEQLMAVFLHEVGHNFFLVKEQIHNKKAYIFVDDIFIVLRWLKDNNWNPRCYPDAVKYLLEVSVAHEKGYSKFYYDILKKQLGNMNQRSIDNYNATRSNILLKAIIALFTVVSKIFSSILTLPFTLGFSLLLPLLLCSVPDSARKYVSKESKEQQNYNAEKFSDNFAASYGYAVEVVELFGAGDRKFLTSSRIVSNVPVLRVIDYYEQCLYRFVLAYADEHPDNPRRCQFMIDKLKHEISVNRKNLHPKQVAEIENQISQIEKLLADRPYYQKMIDWIYENAWAKKDKDATKTYSDTDIMDFDKTIYKGHLKEDVDIIDLIKPDYNENLNKLHESGIYTQLDEYLNSLK